MPQFIIIAYDAKDPDAPARRMACRQAHIDAMTQARASGTMLCGLALLDDTKEKMIGSLIVTHFPDRAAFDAWLATEPYVSGKVWENITVLDAKIGPTFQDMIPA